MNFYQLLILQLIAHLISDFALQPKKGADEKNKLGFKSPYLKWHVVVTFLVAWVFSFQLQFVFAAFAIAALHGLEDGMKKFFSKASATKRYAFFIDQAIHLLMIFLVVTLYAHYFALVPLFKIPLNERILFIIAGFIFCTKPSNIMIKEIFRAFDIQAVNPENEELPNAGKLIGIIERFLVFLFILIHQFEAVGFLIAAKSILRFKNDDSLKTEYVLIGTLLSFGIAIVWGVLAIQGW